MSINMYFGKTAEDARAAAEIGGFQSTFDGKTCDCIGWSAETDTCECGNHHVRWHCEQAELSDRFIFMPGVAESNYVCWAEAYTV